MSNLIYTIKYHLTIKNILIMGALSPIGIMTYMFTSAAIGLLTLVS